MAPPHKTSEGRKLYPPALSFSVATPCVAMALASSSCFLMDPSHQNATFSLFLRLIKLLFEDQASSFFFGIRFTVLPSTCRHDFWCHLGAVRQKKMCPISAKVIARYTVAVQTTRKACRGASTGQAHRAPGPAIWTWQRLPLSWSSTTTRSPAKQSFRVPRLSVPCIRAGRQPRRTRHTTARPGSAVAWRSARRSALHEWHCPRPASPAPSRSAHLPWRQHRDTTTCRRRAWICHSSGALARVRQQHRTPSTEPLHISRTWSSRRPDSARDNKNRVATACVPLSLSLLFRPPS